MAILAILGTSCGGAKAPPVLSTIQKFLLITSLEEEPTTQAMRMKQGCYICRKIVKTAKKKLALYLLDYIVLVSESLFRKNDSYPEKNKISFED